MKHSRYSSVCGYWQCGTGPKVGSNLRGMDANSSVVWRKNVIEYEKKGCRHQLVITPAHVDASLGVSCTSDARQSVQCTSSSSEQARPFRGHRCFCGAFVVTSPKIWRCHWCHILLTLYPPYWSILDVWDSAALAREAWQDLLSLSPSLLRLCLLSGAHRHRCLRHRVSQLLMLLTDLHGSSLEKGDSKYSLPFAGSLKSPSHCGKYINMRTSAYSTIENTYAKLRSALFEVTACKHLHQGAKIN